MPLTTEMTISGHDAHLGGGITGLLISSVLNPAGVMVRPFVFAFITVMLSFYLFYLIKTKGGLIPFHIFSGNLFRKSKKTGTAPVSNKRLNRQQKKIRVVHTKDFRDEVDEILKKISLSGIESLTKEERAKLEEGSKKMKESRD